MDLVRRLLEDSQLMADVQAVDPVVFSRLVRHVGLADAAELLALATPRQLQHLLDDVLWGSKRPGDEERFDITAFVTWLEVLLESGDGYAVERLCELSEDLLALGVHQLMLVFEPDVLGIGMANASWDDAADTEKALDGCLLLELADFTLVSRGIEGWDAVIHALVAMDRDHHDHLLRILERCCAATEEQVEESGGVHALLSSGAMLEADALGERITRLGQRGFVDASTARAFLRGARVLEREELATPPPRDFIATRYFRDLEAPATAPGVRPKSTLGEVRPKAAREEVHSSSDARPSAALEILLEQAGITERMPLRLSPEARSDAFRTCMMMLAELDGPLHAQRIAELIFVVNVLIEGEARPQGGRHGLAEAAQRAIELCNRGLQYALSSTGESAEVLLRKLGTEQLFRMGYALDASTSPVKDR